MTILKPYNRRTRTAVVTFGFLMVSLFSNAQSYIETKMVLVSEDKYAKEIEYFTESTYMALNIATGDFTLNSDLSDLKTGDRKLDSLLNAQGEQILIFKGNISENILTYSQQQNDERTYEMPGQLFFNGNSFACTAQFDPINLADKNEVKNYRMDFRLAVDPDKLNIKVFDGKFAKQIVLEITGGKLNTLN